MGLLLDIILATSITVMGICLILGRNLRMATGLFILFCVFMSLCWIRLQLFWLGVTEAFIGAFLTGSVLWSVHGLGSAIKGPDAETPHRPLTLWHRLFIPLGGALVFMGLAAASALYFHRTFSFTACTPYAVAGVVIGGAGFFAMGYQINLLHRVLAFHLFGRGVFLLIVVFACQGSLAMDAPAFLAASGYLVAFLAGMLVVTLIRRHREGAEPIEAEGGTVP